MFGEGLFKKIAGVFFALLIVNFSVNFIGITNSLLKNILTDIEHSEVINPDLTVLNTMLTAEESQEEEGESSSEKKESSEESDEYCFDHTDEYYFLNKSRLNAHLHFNIRNVFFDAPEQPPQA